MNALPITPIETPIYVKLGTSNIINDFQVYNPNNKLINNAKNIKNIILV